MSSPCLASSTFFILLILSATVASAIETLITTNQIDEARFTSPNLAPPGKNMNGTSVTTNFVDAYNEKQIFLFMPLTIAQFEKPESPILHADAIWWCADMNFTDFVNDVTVPMGYVGRCVWKFTKGGVETVAAGVQGYTPTDATSIDEIEDPTIGFKSTLGISTVYVEQTNVFEYAAHRNTENMVTRFWDDGRKTMPLNMWVTHEGVETNGAHQVVGQFVWLSANEAAGFIGVNTTDLTPEKFSGVYEQVWDKLYNVSSASNEGTTSSSTDATESNVGSDGAVKESNSGARRLLGWSDARPMKLVLRMFGM